MVWVGSYYEGVRLLNDRPCDNGTVIFTNDGGATRRFHDDVEVGMIDVNIPVPVAYHSFGSWKDSLFGDLHAYG
ncbi:aldehyde dehydrogenase family protein [Streptomyces mirabilis]|uniref:aldehyde dehydrogenase family protein n=1 Tax=Streptomyces mirabilis TaxID=68239 RepID=UPI0036997C43